MNFVVAQRMMSGNPGFHLRAFPLLLVLLLMPAYVRAQKRPPSKPVDLNRATVEQLEKLPGIGPSTAKAIVQFREKSGPFERVDDLRAIRGISGNKLEKLRPYVAAVPPSRPR